METKTSLNHETPTDANNMLVAVAESFIGWRDKLHKEIRGGKLMFDVPKHYKWLDESELFTYWMDVDHYCHHKCLIENKNLKYVQKVS